MSSEAQLVILNLPGPPRDTKMERESNCILFSIILKKYRIVQKNNIVVIILISIIQIVNCII